MRVGKAWCQSPCLVLAAFVVLVAARWSWIANGSDFGVAYEPAFRIAHGEVQYRDFYLTLPPLTNYTLAGLVRLAGPTLWSWVVHLYLWWIAALVVGLMLLNRLGVPRGLALPAVLLTAVLSSPPAMEGNSYDYAATCLGGLSFLSLIAFHRTGRLRHALAAGVWIGLCVLAKQNVGILVGAANAVVLVLARPGPAGFRRALPPAAAYLAGCTLGFLPFFAYFAMEAGFNEVYLQMFRDAGAGKGGAAKLLLRSIPRIVLANRPWPYRRPVEAALTLLVLTAIAMWLYRRMAHGGAPTDREVPSTRVNSRQGPQATFLVWAYVGVTVGLSLLTLLPLPAVETIGRGRALGWLPNQFQLLLHLAYATVVLAAVLCLVRYLNQTDRSLTIVSLMMLGLAYAHGTAGPERLGTAAPVVLPLFAFVLWRTAGLAWTRRMAWKAAFVAVVLAFLASPYVPVFKHLERLPQNTRFASLWCSRDHYRYVQQMTANIAPRIDGKPTLWLCWLGPHSAFGGRSVFNVAVYYYDTYHSRVEDSLFSAWEKELPEFVVLGHFKRASGARRLSEPSLHAWLDNRYGKVWQGETVLGQRAKWQGISLWRRKSG